jgi:hypothetical protein
MKVMVLLPCKGQELSFEENLKALKNQSYKNYHIVAIVDSESDPSVQELKRQGIKYTITSKKFQSGSGKVNALSTAISKFRDCDVYVIVDSDVTVRRDWLAYIVAPLEDPSVGVSTTFPIFEPDGRFWSKVKCVWGLVGMGMMESNSLRFGWGGSLAFRKNLLDKRAFKYFRSYVADDVALTQIAKAHNLKVSYVRRAQPHVISSENLWTFSEWANRQTAHSINGDPKVFREGILFYSTSILLFLSGIALTLSSSVVFVVFLIPYAIGMIKAHRRLSNTKCRGFVFINTVMPFLLFVNLVKAKTMRTIEWRGRKYRLRRSSPTLMAQNFQ